MAIGLNRLLFGATAEAFELLVDVIKAMITGMRYIVNTACIIPKNTIATIVTAGPYITLLGIPSASLISRVCKILIRITS